MAKGFYDDTYDVDYTTFGGLVTSADFAIGTRNTHRSLSDIAANILSDWSFDMRCKRNAEIRDNYTKIDEAIETHEK